MFDYSRGSLIKILKKYDQVQSSCGASDNAEKGEENFPKIRTIADLFSK